MKKVLTELGAAFLVIAALSIGYARTEEAPVQAPVCITEMDVAQRMGGMQSTFDLKGKDLLAFHMHFKQLTHVDPPSDDHLLVYGNVGKDDKMLLVSFINGCVSNAVIVPAPAFLQVLNGGDPA